MFNKTNEVTVTVLHNCLNKAGDKTQQGYKISFFDYTTWIRYCTQKVTLFFLALN